MIKRGVGTNIKLLIVIKLSKWFMLYMPIIKAFYSENGLTDTDLFVLHAIYSVAIAVLEIPSGYIADVWGRKNALITGTLAGSIGFGVYSVTDSFTGFLIAELIMGVGHSLLSGADSALLYDSLQDMNRKKEYVKYEGRITAFGNFAEAFAAIAGGILASISIRYPYYGQTIITFIGFLAALYLVNPSSHRPGRNLSIRHLLSIVHYAMLQNKFLRINILLSAVIGAATLSMAWFAQIYYNAAGVPLALMGFVWFTLNMAPGLTSMVAHRIEKSLGDTRTVIIIIIGIPLGYIILSFFNSVYGLFIILIFYFIRGLATPVLKDYINRITQSDIRATVLSVRSLIIRLTFAVAGPFFGWVTDQKDLQSGLLTAGIFFLIFAFITGFLFIYTLRKNR